MDLLQLIQGDLKRERFALLSTGWYFDLGSQQVVGHILWTKKANIRC